MVATTEVDVRGGRLRGDLVAGGAVLRMRGIPYGMAVSGPARFLPPAPVAPWVGVRDCLRVGPAAPQPAMVFGAGVRGQTMAELCAAMTPTEPQHEDCLVLNVWAPSRAVAGGGGRPVLVSFHGGAYTLGSSSTGVYDGAWLAEQEDLVVVTVNHRLGALGCLELRHLLGDRYAASGVSGQLDLVESLRWVRDNIAAFGGDPSNVTVVGESGGGWKVCHLLAMPAAAGLFHRAIVQSGPRLRAIARDDAAVVTAAVLAELGLSPGDATTLLEVPADQLVAAQLRALGGPFGDLTPGGRTLAPVLDGDALPRHPFDPDGPAVSAAVPLLVGTTRDELTFFLYANEALDAISDAVAAKILAAQYGSGDLYDTYRRTRPAASARDRLIAALTDGLRVPSIALAERKAAQAAAPVWMYRFDYATDVCDGALGAPHGIDVAYTFGLPDQIAFSGGRAERHQVAAVTAGAWAAFARTGSPQTDALPTWPAYEPSRRATMLIDATCTVADDPDGEERRAWDGIDPAS